MDKLEKLNKYCNCYSPPYGKITAECYDTVMEAINTHEARPDDNGVDSRLVIMKRFWPQFIQKIIVQNAFRKPVVFIEMPPTFTSYPN
jgi:hypothetical protein